MRSYITVTMVVLAIGHGTAWAQGVQTGTIRGVVRDDQNLPVPGATITATSAAVQEPRVVVTDGIGHYVVPALPAGNYTLTFELSGFAEVTQATTVPLGLTVEVDVRLRPAGVAEVVQVVAELPGPIATPVVGANFKQEEIERLATPRTLQGIAQLSPAVNENAPNVGQVVINGAFAFDNVFMINGVDVNDNLFAQPNNLFIEDAIEETQVLTSGISAEYGRFSGGVINAVTKNGGDRFSGSGRINFLNPAWTTETPFEEARGIEHVDELSEIYEGTFGGPLVTRRLWFFAAGRYGETSNQITLPQTGVALTGTDNNKRGELKLTGTVAPGHTVQGGFVNNPRTRTNNSGLQQFIIDPRSEVDRKTPNWYYHTNYRGLLNNKLLAEAQYSERRLVLTEGGTSTAIVDSPFSALSCACIYNAPYFDATDPQERNNRQVTGNITGFWNLAGRHDTKAGYEFFRSQLIGGNSQSSTSYVFNADFVTDGSGRPVLDSNGRLIPMFEPGASILENFAAVRGAELNINNHSVYVQDHWVVNSQWSFDLGARFELVKSRAVGDIVGVNTWRIVPRLAAAYDVFGERNHILHVTYGQYSGRYTETQIRVNSRVGNPAYTASVYRGPAGQGLDFAPGFDVSHYPVNATNAAVSDGTQNVQIDDFQSPLTHEFTTSYGLNLSGGRGYAEVSYAYRKTTDLIEDFATLASGFTEVTVNGVSAGRFTNRVYRNTDEAYREFQGMVFQSRYRLNAHWDINGHYTLQLKNEGNYEGEATGQPGSVSLIGDYPEAFDAERSFPAGRLQNFQRSRVRIWSTYLWSMGPMGDLSVSGLWRYDSGRVFSLAARNQALTAVQRSILAAAGYPDAPPSVGNHVFFAERGSETFPGYGLFDTSINYNIPVFRALRPWLKLDVYNVLNNRKLIAWNTVVTQNRSGPLDRLGLATTYTRGAAYGTASGNTVTNLYSTAINAYPVAFTGSSAVEASPGGRTIRIALGFRF